MATEKSLKFQFVLDDTSFTRVRRALDELIEKSKTLAKTLQGVGVGGGLGGTGGVSGGGGMPSAAATIAGARPSGTGGAGGANTLTQVVLQNADAFKKLGTTGSDSLKGLTATFQQAFRTQRAEAVQLQSELSKLQKTYEALKRESRLVPPGQTQGMMGRIAEQMAGAQARLGASQSEEEQLRALARGLFGRPGAPGAGPGAAAAGVPGAAAGGAAGPGAVRAVSGTGLGAAFGQIAQGNIGQGLMTQIGPGAIGGQGIAQWLMGGTAGAVAARAAGLVGAGGAAILNTSQAFNNMYLDTRAARGEAVRPAYERMKRADVRDAMIDRTIAKMTPQEQTEALRSVGSKEEQIKSILGAVAGAVGSGGKGISAITPDTLGTEQYNRLQQMREKVAASADYYAERGRAMEYLDETRGSRMVGSRILGAGIYKARPGERGAEGGYVNRYTPLAAQLHREGFSVEELAASTAQARQMGGRQFAGQFAGTMMSAGAAGYGQVGDVLAAAARSGGLAQARGLTQAALGGGIDTAAGLQLGAGLFGFDPRGTVTGAGALKAIQQGFQFTGGPEDFNAVARAQLGMQSASRLSGGFDPYQQGMNLVSAIGAMPGASSYAQDALAGRMEFKELAELAAGGTSARGRAYGIGKEEARSQIAGMSHGLFSRFVDEGGSDPASKAMRAMMASGGSEQDFLADLGRKAQGKGAGAKEARSQLEALGVLASDLMGGDTEAGIGMVQALSGVRDLDKAALKSGKIPGAGIDEAERAKRGAEADQMVQAGQKAIQYMSEYTAALQKNRESMFATESFAKFASSIDTLTEKFMKLAGVTDQAIANRGGSTVWNALPTSPSLLPASAPASNAQKAVAEAARRNQQKILDSLRAHPEQSSAATRAQIINESRAVGLDVTGL